MADTESLYGSSIFHEGHTDEADLPEYIQLCRQLFPNLLATGDGGDTLEPEAEESIARYLKYLTGLPLPSLRMEPALLQSDQQRISKDLAMVLLNETTGSHSGSAERMRYSGEQSDRLQGSDEDGDKAGMFESVYETGKLAESAVSGITAGLDKTQDALSRLEAACAQFSAEMAELDQQAQVVQRVVDKQDLITRIIELPRVMQMCVAGGFYEEAVDISEHVRQSGDRLMQDIRDGAHVLPSSGLDATVLTAASRDQLLKFVGGIQDQVHAEFETMVLGLCRDLSYSHSAISAGPRHKQRSGSGLGIGEATPESMSRRGSDASLGSNSTSQHGSTAGGYDKSMKRLAQVVKIVGILRRIGLFSEAELRMLYLRSRWQAWLHTAESLSGFVPPIHMDEGAADFTVAKMAVSMAPVSPSVYQSPRARRGSERTYSSAETAAYLTRYIDAFFSWLTEAEMHYRTLFSSKDASQIKDPFADLSLHASQQFLSTALPLLSQLNEASGVSGIQALVATHAPALSRGKIAYVLPFLDEVLHERAFASIIWGIEDSVTDACKVFAGLAKTHSNPAAKWEQLATPTRPFLEIPNGLDTSCSADGDPSVLLDRFRVSPVGLLQYPLLTTLLHTFRNCLHALRILVLASDNDRADSSCNEALVLLSMASVVFEAELVRVAEALAALCAQILPDPTSESPDASMSDPVQRTIKDTCAAFVFGLARNTAEIFEEIATPSEPALDPAGPGSAGSEPLPSLYSFDILAPILQYL
ncbi:hypothetical protein GGF46_000546 [Coemansia sp. RSA 552]|nr:hypothetical protein GGF46_000546 [Coemansia sp. RSA 552]